MLHFLSVSFEEIIWLHQIHYMHLAYSWDGKNFEALNYNTGVLFAKNKGTQTKGIKQPYIFLFYCIRVAYCQHTYFFVGE